MDGGRLDRYITGNYGEDQFPKRDGGWAINEWDVCSFFYPDDPYLCSKEGSPGSCSRGGQCVKAIIEGSQ